MINISCNTLCEDIISNDKSDKFRVQNTNNLEALFKAIKIKIVQIMLYPPNVKIIKKIGKT